MPFLLFVVQSNFLRYGALASTVEVKPQEIKSFTPEWNFCLVNTLNSFLHGLGFVRGKSLVQWRLNRKRIEFFSPECKFLSRENIQQGFLGGLRFVREKSLAQWRLNRKRKKIFSSKWNFCLLKTEFSTWSKVCLWKVPDIVEIKPKEKKISSHQNGTFVSCK